MLWFLVWGFVTVLASLILFLVWYTMIWLAAWWYYSLIGVRLDYPSLFPMTTFKELPPEYKSRLDWAREYFNYWPLTEEPEYLIAAGERIWDSAVYLNLVPVRIVFHERILRECTEQELAGILAHEIGHIESEQKKTMKEKEAHWIIDLRGAMLTDRETLLAGLKWFERVILEFLAEHQWLCSFLGWFSLLRLNLRPALAELQHRIGILEKVCISIEPICKEARSEYQDDGSRVGTVPAQPPCTS